jgi:uroporphyrinogen-III synthase
VDVVPVSHGLWRLNQSDRRLRNGSVDAVTFTSPSTFRNFRALVDDSGLTRIGYSETWSSVVDRSRASGAVGG